MLTYSGADAIGADQQIRLDDFAIGKNRPHLALILDELRQSFAAMIMRGRQGVAQQAVKPLPCRRHLRTFDVVRNAPLRIDDLAAGNVDAEFLGGQGAVTPVLVLADDPVGAAMVAGRTRVGRGFQRGPLARSASAAASELAVRLVSSLSVDVEVGEP